jgi:hypothetical protein
MRSSIRMVGGFYGAPCARPLPCATHDRFASELMGRRSRRRGGERLAAPESVYEGPEGSRLTLRGVLSPATRREYAAVRGGRGGAQTTEDAWQRATEFLFERLVIAWEMPDLEPLTHQRELLGRFRLATVEERRWIRDALRAHLAEHFPEVQAP